MFHQPQASDVRRTLFLMLCLLASTANARGEVTGQEGEPAVVPLHLQADAVAQTAEQLIIVGDESQIALGDERVIYSNTFGQSAIAFGADRLISDDIVTTARPGCQLSRLSFEVVGRVDPLSPVGGPYSVTWALYNTCPYAVTAGPARDARRIAFGTVQVPDDARRTIEVIPEIGVALPAHLWFGLTFSRDNAGAVIGAPADIGHSADIFDFPGSACTANVGGFPRFPHGSFNLELWGLNCTETNPQYSARREAGSAFNPEPTTWITDDITLLTDSCLMRAYVVGVRGPGTYNFELREACDGAAIPGTQVTQLVGLSSHQEPRIFEYTFDPPILLPREFVYAVRASRLGAGPILAGLFPSVGSTDDVFGMEMAGGACDVLSGPSLAWDALHFAVICDGPAAVGACCDRYMTFCVGGPRSGLACERDTDCGRMGRCQPICRDTAEINCPFANGSHVDPPRRWTMPQWHEAASCAENPCAPDANE